MYVKIISSGNKHNWYNDKIGEVFKISTTDYNNKLGVLYEINYNSSGVHRYIFRTDVILLNREQKLKRILQCH